MEACPAKLNRWRTPRGHLERRGMRDREGENNTDLDHGTSFPSQPPARHRHLSL